MCKLHGIILCHRMSVMMEIRLCLENMRKSHVCVVSKRKRSVWCKQHDGPCQQLTAKHFKSYSEFLREHLRITIRLLLL